MIDFEKARRKLTAHIRRISATLPQPLRRELFYLQSVRTPLRLRRMPWRLADPEVPYGTVATEVAGSFEPARRIKIYGGGTAIDRFHKRGRDDTLRIRKYENVVVLPHNVVLSGANCEILPMSFGLAPENDFLVPQKGNSQFAFYQLKGEIGPARRIDDPLFLADAQHQAFGHTLVEAVPMLELARLHRGIRVVTSARVYPALFGGMGFNETEIVRVNGPVLCRTLYVPDPPLEIAGHVHSVARQAFERLSAIAAQSSIDPKRRIYLSRSRVAARRLMNEAAVEEVFSDFGFDIVHPEDLSVSDQIKLMISAEAVAGPTGSGMHNLLFAPASTKALFLTSPIWFVDLDRYVAKADDQFGFVFGTELPASDGQTERERAWWIRESDVRDAIRSHFGL